MGDRADARTVVFASGDYWTNDLPVCSHHLARAFARAGWRVAFVSGPITPLHLLPGAASGMGARFRHWLSGGTWESGGHLYAFVPLALVAPTGRRGMRGDWVQRHWWRLGVPGTAATLRRAGFRHADLLCIDGPTHADLLERLPHRRSVLRVVDNLRGFRWHGEARERALRGTAERVDLVTYTATALRGYVESMAPRRSALLVNGVDFRAFTDPQPPPPEYASISPPRAVYAGNLSEWFDFALVDHAAAALPDVSFVLLGPPALARRRLTPRPNVHLLGTRPHAMLPAYLQHAAVGMIPFDVAGQGELVRAVNPLKLYEYLASGLPVVAVGWDELRVLRSPARLCDGAAEFTAALQQAAFTPTDAEEARRFAAGRDWSAIAQRLVELAELD